MIAPAYASLAAEYAGRAVFAKVESGSELFAAARVRSMPTFQFWLDGAQQQQFAGASEARHDAAHIIIPIWSPSHPRATVTQGACRRVRGYRLVRN